MADGIAVSLAERSERLSWLIPKRESPVQRIPEPELMNDPEQAEAYHRADFSEAHDHFVALFRECFEAQSWTGPVLDLGCGTADVTRRFAKAYEGVRVQGIDGAENMLQWGREALARDGLSDRVTLYCRYLPDDGLPEEHYGAVISNSLLHHLRNPSDLWNAIRRCSTPGAPVLVMDLVRPETPAEAAELVKLHAGREAAILQRDFFNSLCAAYRVEEVEQQIRQAGLVPLRVRSVSDRHWIAYGGT